MRTLCLLLAFGIGSFISCFVSAQEKQKPTQSTPEVISPEGKIVALQKQRYEALKQVCEILKGQYAQGICSFDEVLEAEIALANVELDLAPNQSARQIVHERIIERLKAQQEYLEQRFAAGNVTKIDVLLALSARLQAEINMLSDRGESFSQ